MVTLSTHAIFILFTYMQFWVWGILWMWSVCAPTAYEVVHDCRNFEKQWCVWRSLLLGRVNPGEWNRCLT